MTCATPRCSGAAYPAMAAREGDVCGNRTLVVAAEMDYRAAALFLKR